MRAPVTVWIDDRVARGMATEQDLEMAERGVEQVKYIREDVVHRLVRDASGQAEEFAVQLVFGADLLFALMNNGRIWMTNMDGNWEEYRSPGMDGNTNTD